MFEWDALKEQSNITKHGLDFRTAARIFLDRLMIEFEAARTLLRAIEFNPDVVEKALQHA
jgi:uncharacterized DUF497 family protein